MDRSKWKSELQRYCEDKYSDPLETPEVQRVRLSKLRSIQQAAELDGWACPKLIAGVVIQARSRLKTGKSGGGGEDIVAVMI